VGVTSRLAVLRLVNSPEDGLGVAHGRAACFEGRGLARQHVVNGGALEYLHAVQGAALDNHADKSGEIQSRGVQASIRPGGEAKMIQGN
jgi:hypothetical protein